MGQDLAGAVMETYRVSLEVFEGPLDLLLRLIEQERLDITLISLALVTDQYLAYIAQLQEASAANLADFLAIAARLLVIKSRVLLPRPEQPEEEKEPDLGEELVDRLREYKRYKAAASALRALEEAEHRTYPRVAPPPKAEPKLQPGEASSADLWEAMKRVLAAHPPVAVVDRVVSPIAVSLSECIQRVLERLVRVRRTRFSALMRQARSRLEVIVTFIAILELAKQQRVSVMQERLFGEIYIALRQPPASAAPNAELAPVDV